MHIAMRASATVIALWTGAVSAQTAASLAGDYVCAYGCRLTDANPSIQIDGDVADCVNEFGGLFRGKVIGPGAVACFRKTGQLSRDGLTLVWDDGVVWKRHIVAKQLDRTPP